jgi:hypothetical protein
MPNYLADQGVGSAAPALVARPAYALSIGQSFTTLAVHCRPPLNSGNSLKVTVLRNGIEIPSLQVTFNPGDPPVKGIVSALAVPFSGLPTPDQLDIECTSSSSNPDGYQALEISAVLA